MTILEASVRTGFADQGHFTKVFRGFVGVSTDQVPRSLRDVDLLYPARPCGNWCANLDFGTFDEAVSVVGTRNPSDKLISPNLSVCTLTREVLLGISF